MIRREDGLIRVTIYTTDRYPDVDGNNISFFPQRVCVPTLPE